MPYFFEESNGYTRPKVGFIVTHIVGGVFLLVVLFGSWATVPAGHRGVKVHMGAVEEHSLSEGFHWKLPFVQDIIVVNVQTQKSEVQADSASKDLQEVSTTIALNFRIDPSNAWKLYQEIGEDYDFRVIAPAIEEAVKTATAQYTAEELITKRNEVKNVAKDALKNQIAPFHIALEEFSIVNFSFSEEFDRAIEQKVTANELALKAENDLKRVEFEQQQEIEKAKAHAEKARLEALALQNSVAAANLTKKLEAEAMLEFAKKWNGQLPANWVVGGTVVDKFLNNFAK